MKILKTYESWNDNVIDNSLFSSGKAKYNPHVVNGVIKYKTGAVEPYYFAEIVQKGDKFICKIYKKKKNGEEIRLRNKLKKELKLAHNYVREYLNQKLKKKKNKLKDSNNEDVDRVIREEPNYNPEPFIPTPPPRKTVIRRF